MSKPKLAIIGTGNISKFHCDAFKEAGFEISHGAGSKNSQKAIEFGKEHSITKMYSDPHEILEDHSEWDMMLLAIPTEKNIEYLNKIISIGKLALIEKPVSTNSSEMKKFKENEYPFIRVAYNRRFYATMQRALNFIIEEGFVHARMELPEKVDPKGNYSNVLLNSCHGIDLLFYLFKDLKILDIHHFEKDLGRLVTLKSASNDLINLTMNWNSPSNFILVLEGDRRRLEIKPFEDSNIFQGMNIIDPSEELPLRRFVPKKIESVTSFPTKGNLIKPGFLEQSIEMKNLLEGKEPEISASLYDAYRVQSLLGKIL